MNMEELERSQPALRKELNEKTNHYIHILHVQKDLCFLEETEGILKELNRRLNKEGIDTPDLVKKAWKRPYT